MIPLWLATTYRRCDFPGRMTKHHSRSVDAHFHDGAGRVLQSVLLIKVANDSCMTDQNLSEGWFPKKHDQKLLTLRRRSFSWCSRGGIANCFAYNGSQKSLYDWLQSIRGVISQHAWPKIVDALLTIILPRLYRQYAIILFGTVHHSHCFGCLSGVFVYFLHGHYVVL
jgi:hypothetical protein